MPTTTTTTTTNEKTYCIQLRNADRSLMHAGIRRAASCRDALEEYLATMPAPFSSYEVVAASSTHNDDNWQFNVAFGPFMAIVNVEHMTAAPASDAGSSIGADVGSN